MNYNCVIFDLDGTLADTVHDLAYTLNRTLEERGFAPSPMEDFVKMQGKSMEAQLLSMLPPEKRDDKLVEELAAGCFAVGVSWGYRDIEALKNAGAQCIINKPSELLEFL
ncbi:MAG: HAD hydrolase-like protein [Treponema sp.]|jgi:phosphoglycolate phosphatase-like HAD superfamily hydrolase|nr:HAD hydrolase-like protein [Treponema sp.]